MNSIASDRNKYVMDLIRTGREMEVDTLPSNFIELDLIPTKSNLLTCDNDVTLRDAVFIDHGPLFIDSELYGTR